MPVVEAIDLEFRYPTANKKLLRGVSFSVEKNNLVAIVGKIGGGKSTLLQHLNGTIEPQKGDVIINGKSVKEEPNYPFHQQVGLLFENADDQIFYPIVADDIAFGPRNLELSQEEVNSRVMKSAEEVNIMHLLERDTASLSYGEKTLVALAGILAMNSKIILMDSPELGLDLWSKPKILELLQKLKLNHTLIITTNDIDLLKMADEIHLLWNGKIQNSYGSYSSFRNDLSA